MRTSSAASRQPGRTADHRNSFPPNPQPAAAHPFPASLRTLLHLWITVLGGAALLGTPLSRGADYLQSGLSTWTAAPVELVLENPRILSETPWRDGRVLLEIRADVRNGGDSTWEKVELRVASTVADAPVAGLSATIQDPAEIRPGGIVTPTNTLFTVVSAASLTAARSEIAAGLPLRCSGLTGGTATPGFDTNLVAHLPSIVSETLLGGGEYLLEIATSIRNDSTLAFSNLTVQLVSLPGSVVYRPATGVLSSGPERVLPFATWSPPASLLVTVATPDAAAVRAALAAGSGLTRAGAEMWVYAFPPRAIDQETEDAFRFPAVWEDAAAREVRITFTNATPFLLSLQPGDLLVENRDVNLLDPPPGDPALPGDTLTNHLPAFVPFEVKSVTVSSNEVAVVGVERLVVQVIRRATLVASAADLYRDPVRDPYQPDPESTLTSPEKAARRVEAGDLKSVDPTHGRLADLEGMVAIPWHFNTNFISDKVSISGEVLLRQSGVKIETRIEEFQIERITIGMDAGVVVNLVIECDGGEDTRDDPPGSKEKTLFEIDQIPVFTFSLGGMPVSVKPVFVMSAGVEANLPTRLTLPLQSSFTMGMEMGYDRAQEAATGDGFFYRPILDFVPVRVSDPTVFDELAATLSLWAELKMKLLIEAGSAITVESGPSVAMRLENDYRLAPLANPWWEVDLGLDLIGTFDASLDLAGLASLRLFDTSASLHQWELLHLDAGGPLLGGSAPSPRSVAPAVTAPTAGATPLSGAHLRWARQFQPRPDFAGLEDAFVFPIPGSDGEVIVGGQGASSGIFARLTKTGGVAWARDTFPWSSVQAAAMDPAGRLFTAGMGERNSVVASLHTTAGEQLWSTALLPSPTFAIEAAAAHTNAAGQLEYFVGGHVAHTTVRDSDPAVIKFGADGTVAWVRYYANPGDDELRGMTVTSDGHLVVAGFIREIVPPPPVGIPRGGGNLSAGGLLMKLDGQTGDILWATVCPARWSMVFHEVIEAPDGTLYAAGAAPRTVVDLWPCNLFARFSPTGALETHVTVGADPEWSSSLVGAGRTPYDRVRGLKWTTEGLVACGETGLGVDTAAWTMGLTDALGVRFFSAFDAAAGSSRFFDVADSGDGLVAVGSAWCPFPVGTRTNQYLPWVVKLPREGMLRFSEESGYRSLFLQPWTHHSAASHEFQIVSSILYPRPQSTLPPAEVFFGSTHGPAVLEATALSWEPKAAAPAPTAVTPPLVFALEFGAPPGGGGVTPGAWPGFEGWAATFGLPPGSSPLTDTDGDGWTDGFEAFFGRDPRTPETTPVWAVSRADTATGPSLLLSHPRSVFARDWSITLEGSSDLRLWEGTTGAVVTTVPLDATREQVTVTLPLGAGVTHRFYRWRWGAPASATVPSGRAADSR